MEQNCWSEFFLSHALLRQSDVEQAEWFSELESVTDDRSNENPSV